MIVSYTGHRCDKLFKMNPYSKENFDRLVLYAEKVLQVNPPDVVITGGALGWD